jgi:DNA repair exonuclease SbcCD ATPase subunit
MAAPIFIRELRLDAPTDSKVYRFDPGVNLILGSVGTGKTSMLQVIKYALGGNATLSRAVRETVVATTLSVQFGSQRMLIHRALGEPGLQITDDDGTLAYSAVGQRSLTPVSDRYLDALAIPRIRLPRSRSRPTSDTVSVSFWDVFEYLYLNQTQMDTSIVHHTDSVRDAKRRATFELLYGITDEDLARLEVERGKLRSDISAAKRRIESIGQFLTASKVPAEAELRLALEKVSAEALSADGKLASLKREGRQETPKADQDRLELLALQGQLVDLHDRRNAAERELTSLASVAAQLQLELERLERASVATEFLAPIEYRQCPRCLQSIASRSPAPGSCPVCLQPDRQAPSADEIQAETERVQAQFAETQALEALALSERAAADLAIGGISARVEILQKRIDDQSSLYVSRQFAAIERASGDVASLEARKRRVAEMLEYRVELRAGQAEVKSMQSRLEQVDRGIRAAQAALGLARKKIDDLSSLFGDLIGNFDYPWLSASSDSNKAFIDPNTYLPEVLGETFEEASGGSRTLINLAYHLAALRYALQEQTTLLPLFAIIDSPRKNLGLQNPADRVRGERIYDRLATMDAAYLGSFQMIVADNDDPPSVGRFRSIKFTYEHPFIPWVQHPGQGVERIVET